MAAIQEMLGNIAISQSRYIFGTTTDVYRDFCTPEHLDLNVVQVGEVVSHCIRREDAEVVIIYFHGLLYLVYCKLLPNVGRWRIILSYSQLAAWIALIAQSLTCTVCWTGFQRLESNYVLYTVLYGLPFATSGLQKIGLVKHCNGSFKCLTPDLIIRHLTHNLSLSYMPDVHGCLCFFSTLSLLICFSLRIVDQLHSLAYFNVFPYTWFSLICDT